MREIVLDTETTGLDPASGHRVVEIACIELKNHLPTGRTFHRYVNPEREMPPEAQAVHGLTKEFLSGQKLFADIAQDFLVFVGLGLLIIHNAAFDLGFIEAEFKRLGGAVPPLPQAVDTVALARQKFPGGSASLDALCRRFQIDNSARDKHGALLDAQLLAEVYLELIGGREPALGLGARGAQDSQIMQAGDVDRVANSVTELGADRPARQPRPHAPSEAELAAHKEFIATLTDPVWKK